MAVEVKKVLDTLSTKFKGKSISKTYLTKTATRYAAKIENDADIDEYINEREEDILAAGEEADRRVTAALKKPTEGEKKEKKSTEVEIDDDEMKDAPAWAKALLNQNKQLSTELAGFKAEKQQQTLSQRFESDDRLKGIPKTLFKGRHPKTEEEFESAIEEAVNDLKEFAKTDNQHQGPKVGSFKTDKPNHAGRTESELATPGQKTALDAIKKFAETNKPAEAVK